MCIPAEVHDWSLPSYLYGTTFGFNLFIPLFINELGLKFSGFRRLLQNYFLLIDNDCNFAKI